MTLLQAIEEHARIRGSQIALEWLEGDHLAPRKALSFGELQGLSTQFGDALTRRGLRDDRILLPFPPGLEFVIAFLGCLRAGAIAVPTPQPQNRRTDARTAAILEDCTPALCVSPEASLGRTQGHLGERLPDAKINFVSYETLLAEGASLSEKAPLPVPQDIAYLQYTSGTSGTAKGVVIRHENVWNNVAALRRGAREAIGETVLSWLPQYHDMQLVSILSLSLIAGSRCVLMSPLNFLQRPIRWLRAIAHHGASFSGGPNFAYEYCLQRIDEADCADFDLTGWKIAFNSAERIHRQTMERFQSTFARYGFQGEAWGCAYGMAEATAIIAGRHSADSADRRAKFRIPLDHEIAFASCGPPVDGNTIVVVDPNTRVPVSPSTTGEIWVAGNSVASGYWNRPEETAETFQAYLASDPSAGLFLRTGDLGFLDSEGELYVTGRSKDLIVIRGVNHMPADLEASVGACHPALRGEEIAAFSVEAEGDQVQERLIIVAEIDRTFRRSFDLEAIVAAMQRALAQEHELVLDEVILLSPGTLPKTTSGKVQRQVCRSRFLDDSLDGLARWSRSSPLSI